MSKKKQKIGRKPLDVEYALYLLSKGIMLKDVANQMKCDYASISRAVKKYKERLGITPTAIIKSEDTGNKAPELVGIENKAIINLTSLLEGITLKDQEVDGYTLALIIKALK